MGDLVKAVVLALAAIVIVLLTREAPDVARAEYVTPPKSRPCAYQLTPDYTGRFECQGTTEVSI